MQSDPSGRAGESLQVVRLRGTSAVATALLGKVLGADWSPGDLQALSPEAPWWHHRALQLLQEGEQL